jgi:hypothetical protein
LAEHIQRLFVAVQRGAHILGRARLGPVPATPAHVDLRAEFRREIEVAHDFGKREPANVPVVRREATVPEHRVREEVGRRGRDDKPGLVERLAERCDALVPLGVGGLEAEDVVVVKIHPVRPELGQLAHRPFRGHRRADRCAEHIHTLPPDSPAAERETVGGVGVKGSVVTARSFLPS